MIVSSTEWLAGPTGTYEARLPGGRFDLSLDREDWPFQDLCDLALRNNQRRRFLFVSRVLGRHWPVRPADLRAVARALAERLRARLQDVPTVFFGMAETATTLGQAVFREWVALGGRGLYIESSRRRTGDPTAFEFAETHSHATAHTIHRPAPQDDPDGFFQTAAQAVIVDDEATTGATAARLAESWLAHRQSPAAASVTLAVLLHWQPEDTAPSPSIQDIVSLAAGRFAFHPTGDFPVSPAVQGELDRLVGTRRGPRHGVVNPEALPAHWETHARSGERILVLGQGEFGFQPLLLAEAFEAAGASVWVQATTRSPILLGGAIQHIRSFPALSGEGYVEFLYNVPDEGLYDRVILCLEDAAPAADHPIWKIPHLEVRS